MPKNKKYIIDVGANVGDTLTLMLNHTAADFILVEPTKSFVKILKENVQKKLKVKKRVIIVEAYISDKMENYISDVSEGGTAVKKLAMNDTEAEAPTFTFNQLLKYCHVSPKDISLIKSSTSGYDADAIMSFGENLKNIKPLLYIETDIGSMVKNPQLMVEQFSKFWQMDDYLNNMDYKYMFIFDNFGNFICEGNFNTLKSIHRYLLNNRFGISNHTFDYIDFVACKTEHEANLTRKIIQTYLNTYGVVKIEVN